MLRHTLRQRLSVCVHSIICCSVDTCIDVSGIRLVVNPVIILYIADPLYEVRISVENSAAFHRPAPFSGEQEYLRGFEVFAVYSVLDLFDPFASDFLAVHPGSADGEVGFVSFLQQPVIIYLEFQ